MAPTSLRIACAAACVAAASAFGAVAGEPAAAEPAKAEQASVDAAIPQLRRPREDLLSAGQPGQDAWTSLVSEGVVAVVNLRSEEEMADSDEGAAVAAAGMAYHWIPVAGAGDLTEDNAARLWELVEDSGGRVLVHCASGNRVGALLALGAAQEGGMTPEEALALGQSAGLANPKLEAVVRERLGLPRAAE